MGKRAGWKGETAVEKGERGPLLGGASSNPKKGKNNWPSGGGLVKKVILPEKRKNQLFS